MIDSNYEVGPSDTREIRPGHDAQKSRMLSTESPLPP